MSIRKFADVSTGHITKDDSDQLEAYAIDCVVGRIRSEGGTSIPLVIQYEEGFFVYAGHASSLPTRAQGFSHSLRRICREAWKQGFAYVNFDRDGEIYEGIKTHNW